MGDEETPSNGSGSWSNYKRLILRMMEDCVSDVRDHRTRLATLEAQHTALDQWMRDIDSIQNDLRDRMVKVETGSGYVGAEKSLLREIWSHWTGKTIALLLALSAALAAGAAYNAVSDAQVDLNRHLPAEDKP